MIYFCIGFAVSPVEQEVEWIRVPCELGYWVIPLGLLTSHKRCLAVFSRVWRVWRVCAGNLMAGLNPPDCSFLHKLVVEKEVLEEAERNQMFFLCASWIQELLCGRERETRAGEQRFGVTVLLMHFSVGLTLLAGWLEIVVVGEQASICLCFWTCYFFNHIDSDPLE